MNAGEQENQGSGGIANPTHSSPLILLSQKISEAKKLFELYFDSETASAQLDEVLKKIGISDRSQITIGELADFNSEVETVLSGAIGVAAAHRAVKEVGIITPDEQLQLTQFYMSSIGSLGLSPRELREKIDFHREKEKLLQRHTQDLENMLTIRTKELESSHQKLIQSSKMASLGEMAGGIAHEVNTPLSTISFCADSIERRMSAEKFNPEEVKKHLGTIRKTVERIAIIIRGLRIFSRTEDDANKIPIQTKKISTLLEETLALCADKIKSNSIDLTVIGDINQEIYCRPIQLSQVILNLVGNSIDAIAERKEKWIKIEYSENDSITSLSITDSGQGIPAEIAQKIMQPFFTTKDIGKGTGLGLSISAGIIKAHSGNFYLEPNCANTKFVIEIPKQSPKDHSD